MKRLSIWSHPRSRSTALEAYFINRGDCAVEHELLAEVYFVQQRAEPIAHTTIQTHERGMSYEQVKARLSEPRDRLLVHKDFPYHAAEMLVQERAHWAANDSSNLILVRDPAQTLLSARKLRTNLTSKNLGFRDLAVFAEALRSEGANLLVVDSDRLVDETRTTVQEICEFADLSFDESQLSWRPAAHRIWDRWPGWHADVARSTGFLSPSTPKENPPPIAEHEALIAEAQTDYERILRCASLS